MIFNKFDHPIAVKIHADQDLENVSLSGNLGSTILMNQKTYHGKTYHWCYVAQFFQGSAFADCLDNTLLGITIYPQGISQFLVVYLSIP